MSSCLHTNSKKGSGATSFKNHKDDFFHELAHHLPYATVAVACALMVLSLITVLFDTGSMATVAQHSHGCCSGHCSLAHSPMGILFHVFHFVHILFAVTGTMMTFYRYSQRIIVGAVVGIVSASIFCTVSDILLPYFAGKILGADMALHICFFSEQLNIAPFLFIGALNGLVMFYIKEFQTAQSSLQLHFFHTLTSAMASIFYAIANGFSDFHSYIGMFFVLILVAVVLPCTLSDVVVPVICGKLAEKKKLKE